MADRISTPEDARLLGHQIANLRKGSGKSQVDLALETGVERSLISKIESGQFKTFNDSVHKVCTRLGLNPRSARCEVHLDIVFRRLSTLSSETPQLLRAINGLLDVFESIAKRQP